MRIELKSSGGIASIPGLNRPVVLDTDSLSPEENASLTGLITAAGFFDLPAVIGTPRPGAADFRKQTVTVFDGARQHTVEVFEPIANHALAELVAYLKRLRTSPS